jgi:hypothetical protein
MPRDSRAPRSSTLPVVPTNSLVASAFRMAGDAPRVYVPTQPWQRECYRHYEICGEARFAAEFFGNAMSKAKLGIGALQNDRSVKPVSGGASWDYLDELSNGALGQGQMLHDFGVHLTIAGDCYLIGRKVEGVPVWEVLSTLEVNHSGRSWTIDYQDGRGQIPLSSEDTVIRVWQPHPGRRMEADSPFRSMLPVLSEIEWLTRHIFDQTTSRLAGAGILLLPTEATFSVPPPQAGTSAANGTGTDRAVTTTEEVSGIMRALAEVMMASLQNPGHISTRVPSVMKMPGDYIDKVKLLEFWSKLDEKALEMRNAGLSRFADGFDLPREQVAGISSNPGTGGGRSTGVSHWGGWQIEEQTIKMHVEPKLDTVVNTLTIYYLRHLDGVNPKHVITKDVTELHGRPDRSRESIELLDRGVVKREVAARENRFGPEDLMSDEDRREWLLWRLASGSATPEQVQAALALLGVQLPTAAVDGGAERSERPAESPPAPSLVEHPQRPRTPEERVAATVLPVANAIVVRALERTGNRIRQAARTAGTDLPAHRSFEAHTHWSCNGSTEELMRGSLDTAEMLLDGVVDDPSKVAASLHSYCFNLVTTQTPHSREMLLRHLVDST